MDATPGVHAKGIPMNIDRYRNTLIAASVIAAIGVGVTACDKKPEYTSAGDSGDSKAAALAETAKDQTSMAVDTAERVASDTWITTKVKSALLADSSAKGFDVSVKTTNGVVALEGAVKDQAAIDHVRQIAAGVEHVASVDTSAMTIAP